MTNKSLSISWEVKKKPWFNHKLCIMLCTFYKKSALRLCVSTSFSSWKKLAGKMHLYYYQDKKKKKNFNVCSCFSFDCIDFKSVRSNNRTDLSSVTNNFSRKSPRANSSAQFRHDFFEDQTCLSRQVFNIQNIPSGQSRFPSISNLAFAFAYSSPVVAYNRSRIVFWS